jgi:large subunit ribosomal protein L18
MKIKTRLQKRERRHRRARRRLRGTPERPRLSVRITNQHVYVQLIDDEAGRTLASASSCGGEQAGRLNVALAAAVGAKAAAKAKEAGITQVVFDRGGHAYHGRVKAVAEAVRTAGIKV